MGNILEALTGGSKKAPVVDIDLESEGAPDPAHQRVWEQMEEILQRGPDILQQIQAYQGCQDLGRKAMNNPTYENEKEAFEALLHAVDSIATFFDFSKALERTLPELLIALSQDTSEEKGDPDVPLALAKQLAAVLDISLQFDHTRMMRPNLSNDFSYYRRLLPKFNKHKDVRVKDDEASGMALFTAQHIPMMSCLAKAASRAMEKAENVTVALSVMANSCLNILKKKKHANKATDLFCARAMTGAIVLFDHVHHLGAFHKKSPIMLKQAIQVLKKDFPDEPGLLNAIRFSSKHFKDAPESIKNLFLD